MWLLLKFWQEPIMALGLGEYKRSKQIVLQGNEPRAAWGRSTSQTHHKSLCTTIFPLTLKLLVGPNPFCKILLLSKRIAKSIFNPFLKRGHNLRTISTRTTIIFWNFWMQRQLKYSYVDYLHAINTNTTKFLKNFFSYDSCNIICLRWLLLSAPNLTKADSHEGSCSRSMLQGHAPGAELLREYQRFHGYTSFSGAESRPRKMLRDS